MLGLADEMIKTHTDARGRELPAYGFFNNDDYKKIQPKDSIPILYSMKANGPLKSKINGNAYSRLNGGLVRFLISEQEARNALLGTKLGQKMTMRERVQRLLPHEQTTKLFEEMGNLRVKNVGMDIVLEAINKRFHDDRYYAFAYGLWRIKEIEEAQMKKQRAEPDVGLGTRLQVQSHLGQGTQGGQTHLARYRRRDLTDDASSGNHLRQARQHSDSKRDGASQHLRHGTGLLRDRMGI